MATQALHPGNRRNFHHLHGRYPATRLAEAARIALEDLKLV
jgi:hypothetical protein